MLGILIAIIVIVGVAYLAVVIYQHLLLQKVRLVEKKNKNIQGESLRKALEKVGRTKLSGKSLEQFQDDRDRYHEIHDKSFDVVDRLIQDIERDSRSLNFLKTRQEYLHANRVVREITTSIKDIKSNLGQLSKLSQHQHKALVSYNDKLRKIHKSLLTKNYIYGPSVNKIQDYLDYVKSLYNNFVKLAENGDHDSAEEALKKLETNTSTLSLYMKSVPALYKDLATIYPKQVSEIKHGLSYMLNSGYQFPEQDLKGAVKYVEAKVKKTVGILKGLNINQVKSNCHQIETMINQLYDAMAREIKAKRQVNNDVDVISEYIEHAQKQNYVLMTELRRLSQNYDLNHNEIQTTKKLSHQLAHIDAVHHKDMDAMASNSVIYSDALDHQKKAEKQLGNIETQQRKINDSVYDLNREESSARDSISKFSLTLHNINRKVSRLNLPGLPKSYIDYYNIVFNEMKHLSDKINQVKISMDDINKRLVTIRTDMSKLREKTNDLIDDAALSEQLMQYSNRYRNSYANVAHANKEARALFENEYNYHDSLSTISSAIDKVEPGASKRIEKEYYKHNK